MWKLSLLLILILNGNSHQDPSLDFKSVVPGHLDLLPEYQEKFPHLGSYNAKTRIVGGEEAVPHSRPYQVALIIPTTSGDQLFCGGSLIDEANILTAAHCLDDLSALVSIYLGAHTLPPSGQEEVFILETNDIVIHPQWDRISLLNDIALIRLAEPLPLSETMDKVSLPEDSSQDYLGNITVVSGWGYTSEISTDISTVLNIFTSHVMSNYACRLAYLGSVESTHICMSNYVGQGACSGDLGGPLTVDGVQVGIMSFASALGCAQGYPSVFTRVTSYLDWISANSFPVTAVSSNSSLVKSSFLS